MTIKSSLLGLLIYAALAFYAAAFALGSPARRPFGRRLVEAGCVCALGAVVWRALSTGHIPLQNLFEVFLVMGALMAPLSRFRRRWPAAGERMDPLLGAILLFPAGFIFPETPRPLPPALQSPLFAPHVLVYLVAYVFMAKAAITAAGLFGRRTAPEQEALDRSAHALASWGYPLLTLGLILGAWWGKRAWGDYWHWDPKEMWALATWLIFTGYFHARTLLGREPKRLYAGLLLAGLAAIILTLSWVNLSKLFVGLHSYAM